MSDPVTSMLITVSIIGLTLVCVLHSLSAALLHEVKVIDLRRETARLHNEHMKRMAGLRAGHLEMASLEPAEPLSRAA